MPEVIGNSGSNAAEGAVALSSTNRSGGKKQHLAKSKKNRIPRPPNAFILYRKHHHPGLKAAKPELHNNEICT